MEKTIKIGSSLTPYYIHEDGFGRLYFDACATDEEHMFAKAPEGADRRMCRIFINDLFKGKVGKKGALTITIDFEEKE